MAAVGTPTAGEEVLRTAVAAGTHTAEDFTVEATSRAAASTADPVAAGDILATEAGTAAFRVGSVPRAEGAADPTEDLDLEDSNRFLPVLLGKPAIPGMVAAGRVQIVPPSDA